MAKSGDGSHVDLSLFHQVPLSCPPRLPESCFLSQTKQVCPLKVLMQIQNPRWESAPLSSSKIFEKIFPNNGIYVFCLRQKQFSTSSLTHWASTAVSFEQRILSDKQMWTWLFCSSFTVPMISLVSRSDFTELQRGSLHSPPSCAYFCGLLILLQLPKMFFFCPPTTTFALNTFSPYHCHHFPAPTT